MTLFDPASKLKAYTSGEKATAYPFQAEALKTMKDLNVPIKFKDLYMTVYKRAGGQVDLSEFVEKAKKNARSNPGGYFLKGAMKQLGMTK